MVIATTSLEKLVSHREGKRNEEGGSNSFMEGTSASVGLLLAGDAVTTALR